MTNIAVTFNDAFFVHAYTMLYSLAINTKSLDAIHLYVISPGLLEENRKKILELFPHVEFVDVNSKDYASFGVIPRLSQCVYYRLNLPAYIPADKVLFLDSDIIVRHDIVQMYNAISLTQPLAAVRDVQGPDGYFNAGVMLIDLALWRKEQVFEKAKQLYTTKEEYPFCEQDLLNKIFKDKWQSLPLTWNFVPAALYTKSMRSIREKTFSKQELLSTLTDPAIIHYVGYEKPWTWPFSSSTSMYWEYRKKALGDTKPAFTIKYFFMAILMGIGRVYRLLPESLRIKLKVADRTGIFVPKRN